MRKKFLTFLLTLAAIVFAAVPPVQAQVGGLMFPGPGPRVSSGGSTFSLTYESSGSSGSTATTIDFGTLTYGSGCAGVVVGNLWIPGSTNSTITGITIGGTALSQVSSAYVSGGSNGISGDIWESSASLSGSSGDVQVTYSAAGAGAQASVALYCLVTTTPAASSVNTGHSGFASTVSAAITVPSGGGGIAMFAAQNGTAVSSVSGATIDVTVGSYWHQNFAHTTTTGSVTVTPTFSASDGISISAAAWGP